MSYLVTKLVTTRSQSKRTARTLAMVLSEIAHTDGVAWATIDFEQDDPQWKKERSLAYTVNVDESTVRRATAVLQQLDELETVLGFDGRRRFYVYRLIVGGLRLEPVDYGRKDMPRLAAPFWTAEELELPKEDRPTAGHIAPWIPRRLCSLHTRGGGDGCADCPPTGVQIARRRVGESAHPYRSLQVQDRSTRTHTEGPDQDRSVRVRVREEKEEQRGERVVPFPADVDADDALAAELLAQTARVAELSAGIGREM